MYSEGGQGFIVLHSTAANGTVSRIVPQFAAGEVVTNSKNTVDKVVTEYGVADLFMKSIPDRVKAMISIAHPDFREDLERQAFEAGLLIPATLPVNV